MYSTSCYYMYIMWSIFLEFGDMEVKRKILKSHETYILKEARDYDLWLVSRNIVLLEVYLNK